MSDPLTCPMCGTPVRVVSADEGTAHYEPLTAQPAIDVARASYLLVTDFERLEEWGRKVYAIFGDHFGPYLVGSAMTSPDYRDVDVRVIVRDSVFDRWWGDPVRVRYVNAAISTWGQRETGLPIDFQVQRQTEANAKYKGPRNALGLRDWKVNRTSGVPAVAAERSEP